MLTFTPVPACTAQPIAQNFALEDEAVNIILPDVPTGDRYFLVRESLSPCRSNPFGAFRSDQGFYPSSQCSAT